MHPLAFAALLAGASLAMVYAMVQYSRARLASRDPGRWRIAYLVSWAAILVLFLGDELRPNLPLLLAFPLAWFALHWLILRFGIALRDAPQPPPRHAPVAGDDEEEEAAVVGADVPPSLFERAVMITIWLTRWLVSLGIAMAIIVVGQALPFLHDLDAGLAPYRGRLLWIFAIGIAAGWLVFMIAIITFILRGGQSGSASLHELADAWRDGTWTTNVLFFVTAGVAIWIACAIALGIVALPPGPKLLVIVAAVYLVVRLTIGFTSTSRRTRHTPSGR